MRVSRTAMMIIFTAGNGNNKNKLTTAYSAVRGRGWGVNNLRSAVWFRHCTDILLLQCTVMLYNNSADQNMKYKLLSIKSDGPLSAIVGPRA